MLICEILGLSGFLKAVIRKKVQKMGENGRRHLLEHFERKKITKKWKKTSEKKAIMSL